MIKNRILHIFEWNFWGGVQSSTLSLIKELKEYDHYVLQLYRKESTDLKKCFEKNGAVFFVSNGKLREKNLSEINPKIIFLHSINKKYIVDKNGWLKKYKVITLHHYLNDNYLGDLNWFVSKYLYEITPENINNKIIVPPPIYVKPFLNLERPKRKLVIGRIQSKSMLLKGKFPLTFMKLIHKLNHDIFIVGPQNGNADVIPDMMPQYLKEIDIFVIWGETKETWSLVISEANLSGIPVVARRMNDGLTEQLEKSGGGILVDTEEEFIDAINMLINDENKRNEIAEKGKYWCLENTTSKLIRGYL